MIESLGGDVYKSCGRVKQGMFTREIGDKDDSCAQGFDIVVVVWF